MANADYPTHSMSRETLPLSKNDRGDNSDTLGLVLCGGAGRRMDGKDKGLIDIDGRPAVVRALELLEPICEECFVSANRNIDRYAKLHSGTVISDLRPDFQGPLAGIEAVIPKLTGTASSKRLLLLPCDLPKLSAAIPKRLLEELEARPDMDIVYARTDSQSHYLCAALRCGVLASLTTQLDNGDRAVYRWYAQCASTALLFTGELAEEFDNANRAEDLNPQPQ